MIRLHGEYDLASVALLAETLAAPVTLVRSDLVIDLSNVTFLDASIMGVFGRTRELLSADDRAFALVRPPPLVARVLDLGGLGDLVDSNPPSSIWLDGPP